MLEVHPQELQQAGDSYVSTACSVVKSSLKPE